MDVTAVIVLVDANAPPVIVPTAVIVLVDAIDPPVILPTAVIVPVEANMAPVIVPVDVIFPAVIVPVDVIEPVSNRPGILNPPVEVIAVDSTPELSTTIILSPRDNFMFSPSFFLIKRSLLSSCVSYYSDIRKYSRFIYCDCV